MSDINIDPTEHEFAYMETNAASIAQSFPAATKAIRDLAAVLRATRTELETARQSLGYDHGYKQGFRDGLHHQDIDIEAEAETTLQQAQQLARDYRETNGYPAVTYALIDLLLRDEP